MVYTAPFHRYIINILKIFFRTYQNESLNPIFEKSKLSEKEISDYFKSEIEKKNANISFFQQLSGSSIGHPNSLINSKSKDITSKSKVEYINKKKKLIFNNILDSINFNGAEYEIHIQCLISQILKCYETKENSFNINFNVEYNFNKKNFDDVEFDFIINDLEPYLFKSFLGYLKDNIIYFTIKNSPKFPYIITKKKTCNIEDVINSINIKGKIDILGEIGLSGWKDDNKKNQFIKYSGLLNLIENDSAKIDKNFFEKTGMSDKNTKILLFITDSKFKELYQFIDKSNLINEMKNYSKEVNSILLYMGFGLSDKVILSNYLSENNGKDSNTEIIKLNIKKTDYEVDKSERFKKSCFILNTYLNNIKELKFNLDKNDLLKVFRDNINSRKIDIKFELDKLDNYKIEKSKKNSNVFILHFFSDVSKESNNLKEIIGDKNYLRFIFFDKKNNEIQLSKVNDLNKINNIFIVVLEDMFIEHFADIFKNINFKYYDIFITISKNSNNKQSLESIKKENNYHFKSLKEKEDLQKIEKIKKDANDLLQKLNSFF